MKNLIREIKNTNETLLRQCDIWSTFGLWKHSPCIPHLSKPMMFVQGRKNHKWKQTWLLPEALALTSQITAEKPETEISITTSVWAILMKPWKVASFQGQWGEIRSGFSAFFPMDEPIFTVSPVPIVCQGWALEPMKEQARLMFNTHLGSAQHPHVDLGQENHSQQG